MSDTPTNAWTGRGLLDWLAAHPQWLDRPVHLLVAPGYEDDGGYLTGAEEDRYEPAGPDVIALLADGPDKKVTIQEAT